MAVQGYRQGSAARGFRYIVPHVSYSPGSRSYCSLNKSRKNPKSFSMADRASVTRPTEPTLESQFQGPHTSEQLPVHLTGRDREYFTVIVFVFVVPLMIKILIIVCSVLQGVYIDKNVHPCPLSKSAS